MNGSQEKGQRVLRRLAQIGCDDVARRISASRCAPLLEMLGDSRERGITSARRELWTVIYDSVPEMSLPRLGRIVEREHTTVLDGINMRRAEIEAELVGRPAPRWRDVVLAKAVMAKGRAA